MICDNLSEASMISVWVGVIVHLTADDALQNVVIDIATCFLRLSELPNKVFSENRLIT